MQNDNLFNQRKKDILSKEDKSSKGGWDEHIFNLCKKINLNEDYYTTSSCSGRVVLMKEQNKKAKDLFLFVSHDLISFEQLKDELTKIADSYEGAVKFKLDPCILHVACSDIDKAKEICEKAKLVGWKRSGIIGFGKNVIIELNSTEKFEFPVVLDGKILVDDFFLKIIVGESNKKLKKSWEKINKLNGLI